MMVFAALDTGNFDDIHSNVQWKSQIIICKLGMI